MKILHIFFTIIVTFNGFAQNEKFSIELNYPLIIKSSYDNQLGIIDGEFKYRIFDFGKLKTGLLISYNRSIGHLETQSAPKYKRKFNYYNINLFEEFKLNNNTNLNINFGYTMLSYKYEHNVGDYYDSDFSTNKYNGLNIGVGLLYNIYKNVYFNTKYCYVYTLLKEGYPKYETILNNLSKINFGLGYKF